jgi:hypothetical protein
LQIFVSVGLGEPKTELPGSVEERHSTLNAASGAVFAERHGKSAEILRFADNSRGGVI